MKRVIIFIVVLCSLSLFVGARDFILKKASVSIWFPDNWIVQEPPAESAATAANRDLLKHVERGNTLSKSKTTVQEAPDVSIVAVSPDRDIFCRLDLIPAINDYTRIIANDFSNWRPMQNEPVTDPAGCNGLPFKFWQGQAIRNGQNWNLSLNFYKVPNGTVIFVYGMLAGADAKYAGIVGDLRRMCTSIKSVSASGW